MIAQNILLEMVSGQAASNITNKRTKATGDRNVTDFNNVFKESMNKSDSKSNLKSSNEKSISNFRQMSKNKPLGIKGQDKTLNGKMTEIESTDAYDKDASKVKENAIINGIADLMGVSNNELINLMSAIGISPSALCNVETASTALSKLSDVLGLNVEQNQNLMTTVKEINLLVDNAFVQSTMKGYPSGKEGWVKVQGVNIEVVNITKPDFKEIASEIDVKIHNLVNSVKKDSSVSFDEVIQKMRQLTQGLSMQNSIGVSETKNESLNYEQSEDHNDDSSNNDTEKNSISKSTSIKQSLEESLKPQESIQTNEQDPTILNNINLSEASKAANINRPERISNEIKTVRNEIMSQVVEKAKVMLDGQKSEMIMELKPESLGKLSLKVVTENGIVMAKFLAESQQVKEVIESNMQLLKDSLEKQGLSVQGFSVSVGQDSEKGYNGQWNMNREKNADFSGRATGETILSVPFTDAQMAVANPYVSNESSVDFRA